MSTWSLVQKPHPEAHEHCEGSVTWPSRLLGACTVLSKYWPNMGQNWQSFPVLVEDSKDFNRFSSNKNAVTSQRALSPVKFCFSGWTNGAFVNAQKQNITVNGI